jgi:hypothetical protein
VLLAVTLMVGLESCAGQRSVGQPIKWVDPDTLPIPRPKEVEENQIWDIVNMTVFYQIGKVLDLGWTTRRIARMVGLAGAEQAHNVNTLDEVANSSWFTRRHYWRRMSREELQRGPNITEGPDTSGVWTIVSGKFEGGTAGFTIEDRRGDRYLLKFDALGWPEMGSAAEVISTKIFYAAGYNVPQNTIIYFRPSILRIGDKAKVAGADKIKRKMTPTDLEEILSRVNRHPDGLIRAMASKFLPGRPVGVFNYVGRRKDDPNDRVDHQHRRELRGMRMISAWLNDADRRAANTLDMYTSSRYVRHYLIDFGSTLGSNNKFPHGAKYGYEYLVDPRTIAKSYLALGLWHRRWLDGYEVTYPSVGYFESDYFDPFSWVPTYPNPAFEKMTLRDAFWGAKIVTSFTNDDLRAIVATAKLSNPEAEAYLLEQLIRRRDKIGRAVFSRINPVDKFQISERSDGSLVLSFVDLAVEAGLVSRQARRYRYRLSGDGRLATGWREVGSPQIVISLPPAAEAARSNDGLVSKFHLQLQSSEVNRKEWSKKVEVFVRRSGRDVQIVQLKREE